LHVFLDIRAKFDMPCPYPEQKWQGRSVPLGYIPVPSVNKYD
jgi:hypothetical protein